MDTNDTCHQSLGVLFAFLYITSDANGYPKTTNDIRALFNFIGLGYEFHSRGEQDDLAEYM